jgi:hypothetical protein
MMTELEQLELEDTLVDLNMLFEQRGCREVLKTFRAAFPAMFDELLLQINRLTPEKQIPALERPFPDE